MERIRQLYLLGQSIWYDDLDRALVRSGRLAELAQAGGVYGVTTNPSIFQKALSQSDRYADAIARWQRQGVRSPRALYEHLVVEDVRAACDALRPLYERTHGQDGFVSLEVDPHLAYDADATLAEAQRLWSWVDRPNLLIKIPATAPGLRAIEDAIAAGVPVNVTLLFSVARYRAVVDAYLRGLERRAARGLSLDVPSVASFFVSRIDTKVDAALKPLLARSDARGQQARELLGTIAVANARQAYQAFKAMFATERFARLAAQGARVQRLLWASTSTKNPAYPDTKYVDELIGPNTVNTVPPHTWQAFVDHGTPRLTLEQDPVGDAMRLVLLQDLGIDLDAITQALEEEGVRAFVDAFDRLLAALAAVS
ncbi:MAG: transaldolase [Chloroflexi bacterium]|nr:transaldolase [Chloroflexota bacterium]